MSNSQPMPPAPTTSNLAFCTMAKRSWRKDILLAVETNSYENSRSIVSRYMEIIGNEMKSNSIAHGHHSAVLAQDRLYRCIPSGGHIGPGHGLSFPISFATWIGSKSRHPDNCSDQFSNYLLKRSPMFAASSIATPCYSCGVEIIYTYNHLHDN